MRVPEVWITSPYNLRCPTCKEQLHVKAGRFDVLGKPTPTYNVDGFTAPVCPNRHDLPGIDALFTHRDDNGYPPEGAVREVPPPR